jgi:hypothetical protein
MGKDGMMSGYGNASTTWAEPASPFSGRWRADDSSAFTFREVERAPAPSAPDSSAFPGELLTEAVADNLEDRRVLLRVFRKLAKADCITRPTQVSLEGFLDALPRAKYLPTVSPDGEGGLTMAWPVPGRGRTLVTVSDSTFYVVGNAGMLRAIYLPDIHFAGTLPDELLALIP